MENSKNLLVELVNGFFVEIDPMNYTLKERKIAKDKKTNEDKEIVVAVGYFSRMDDLIERFLYLNQLKTAETESGMCIKRYLELVMDANITAVSLLKDILDTYPIK